jgi:hypothetical protein
MSAPITEAHREAAVAIFAIAMKSAHHGAAFREPCAQLIADSQARACDQLRAEVERLKADGAASAFINMSCRASRAEAELAAERARLDWLDKNCHVDLEEYREGSRKDGGVPWWSWKFSAPKSDCFTAEAAIDAAMKEDPK